MRLSLSMIVRDEEAALPRCLRSVEGVVDEIVIVDTGSTDRTIEIAKSFGARVYSTEWQDDFAAARNCCLRRAAGDWVLVLDADETLVGGVVPQIAATIDDPDALVINLLREEIGARQAAYSMTSRLFRRHRAITFSDPYHAQIDDSAAAIRATEPHWRFGEIAGVAIRHDGYRRDRIAARNKRGIARRIMERHLHGHPDDAYTLSKLGALYVESGEVEEGVGLLRRGLDIDPLPVPVRYELHLHLATALHTMGKTAEAQSHFTAATSQPLAGELKVGAFMSWANLKMDKGRFDDAQRLLERVLAVAPNMASAHNNLGLVLRARGDLRGALNAYAQAIALEPDYADAYQNRAVALLKQGEAGLSVEAFRVALALHEQQDGDAADRLRQGLADLGLLSAVVGNDGA